MKLRLLIALCGIMFMTSFATFAIAAPQLQTIPVGYTVHLDTGDPESGVIFAKYYINGKLIKTVKNSKATFSHTFTKKGLYTLVVVSKNKAGLHGREEARIRVQ